MTDKKINKMIDYCTKNIDELLTLETTLKPFESANKVRINQLFLVREFLWNWERLNDHIKPFGLLKELM